jgi:hypothetical protein
MILQEIELEDLDNKYSELLSKLQKKLRQNVIKKNHDTDLR